MYIYIIINKLCVPASLCLQSAVLSLQAKVALLDATHVSTMGTQLQGLLAVLEQLQKQSPPSSEIQTKVRLLLGGCEVVAVLNFRQILKETKGYSPGVFFLWSQKKC